MNLQYPWFKINNFLHDAAQWTLYTGLHQLQQTIFNNILVNCQETIIITLKLCFDGFLFLSICVDLLAGRFAQLNETQMIKLRNDEK